MENSRTTERQTNDAPAPHDGDIIRYDLPDWMSPEQRAEAAVRIRNELDRLVEEIGCVGRPWCHMDQWPDQHEEHHASSVVNLAHYEEHDDPGPDKGWWCWLTQQRGVDQPIELTIEGTGLSGKLDRATMSPYQASLVLLATETPEAREALLALFRQVNES